MKGIILAKSMGKKGTICGPNNVCDVVLGQPYMWRRHVVYESRPHSVIITLGGQLYRIPEVVTTTSPPKVTTLGS
jgi:hypothetical protein